MTDIATATVEVLALFRTPNRGRLLATAQVELVLDGVALIVQGVRIIRRADGLATVEPPCFRHTDGDLVPAIVLPPELDAALARAVLAAFAPTALPVPVPA